MFLKGVSTGDSSWSASLYEIRKTSLESRFQFLNEKWLQISSSASMHVKITKNDTTTFTGFSCSCY